jgi:membrane fusion protein (multidrug efflux system)
MNTRPLSLQIIVGVLLLMLLYLLGSHWLGKSDKKDKKAFELLVTTETVRLMTVQDAFEALGTTASNEAVALSATVTARVQALHFEDGAKVEQGALLVELDASGPRADAEEKRVNLAEEERQLRHLSALIERKAVSQTDVEKQQTAVSAARAQLEAAQGKLKEYSLRAPFAGSLGVRRVSVGALVSPGTVVTTLDDLSRIKVDFSIPETALPGLRVGMQVTARSQAFADKALVGAVTFIDSRIDPVTRSVTLRAHLDNEAGLLRPGMLLTVELLRPIREALMVPERSVAPLRGQQFVFVLGPDKKAQKRTVTLGSRQQGRVEILSGVSLGETLVVDGGMSLQDGMSVKVKETTAASPAPATGK